MAEDLGGVDRGRAAFVLLSLAALGLITTANYVGGRLLPPALARLADL